MVNKNQRLFSLFLFILSPLAYAKSQYNMPMGVTSVSHDIYQLHMTIFWICVIIGVAVFSVMFYALIHHRKSKGAKAANFHEHLWVEIIWTIIPTLILIGMAIPATRVLMHMDDSADAEVNIKITGYQWKWKYDYLDEGFGVFSNLASTHAQIHNQEPKGEWYLLEVDEPLVVPVHKKIRFLITANDVIHSWWVPELGVKQDGIPGFINETWTRIDKEGTYRGQCTELCGMYHGYMPVVVKAVSEEDYQAYIAEKTGGGKHRDAAALAQKQAIDENLNQDLSHEELMSLGEAGYLKHCAVCHQVNGKGMPPTFPAMINGKITTGPLDGHIHILLHGQQGSAMQSFSYLTNKEIASIITYERNAWGNHDVIEGKGHQIDVQPNEIEAAR